MTSDLAKSEAAAEAGIEEAEACVQDACSLLVGADVAGVERAGFRLARAVEIFSGWVPGTEPSTRRLELHRSVQRAGRLLEAIGRWCEYRRSVLFPEQTTPPCYGADGRTLSPPNPTSVTLQG